MRSKIIPLAILLASIFGLVFTGCRPSSQNAATPTVDERPAQTEDALRTQSALTLEAAMTEAAIPPTETVEVISPSDTPENTATVTNSPTLQDTATVTQTLPPTETPTITPTITQTASLVPNWYSRTPRPPPLLCTIIQSLPTYKTVLKPGEDFDARWTILNGGMDSWTNANVVAVFRNGAKLQRYTDIFYLSEEIKQNETLEIIIDMQAPYLEAYYQGIWMLTYDDVPFCYFSVNIVVEEN